MADHAELVKEMIALETLSSAERLKLAKKRRQQQVGLRLSRSQTFRLRLDVKFTNLHSPINILDVNCYLVIRAVIADCDLQNR